MARLIVSILFFTFLSLNSYGLDSTYTKLNISVIERTIGVRGHFENTLFKISVPRSDLNIVVNGMLVTSDMGLTSWVLFKKSDDLVSLSGEFILLQDQVNPVMSVALANGLKVKGLYSPFLWDSPRVLSMKIAGTGTEMELGLAVARVFKEIKKTVDGKGDFPFGNTDPGATLNPEKIESILGAKGFLKNGTYKVIFGKEFRSKNEVVDKVMADNTWASFVGSDAESVIDGNIVVREAELQNVLKSLRRADIYVLAIDHHTINDDPDYVFIHYWGIGSSQVLARALKTTSYIARNDISRQVKVKQEFLGLVNPSQTGLLIKKFNRSLLAYHHLPPKKNTVETLTAGVSELFLSLEDKFFNYIERITVDVVYGIVIAKDEIHTKKAAIIFAQNRSFNSYQNVDKLSKEFNDILFTQFKTGISIPEPEIAEAADTSYKNTQHLINKIKTALNIYPEIISNSLLQRLLVSYNTKYTNVDVLVSAYPIIFPVEAKKTLLVKLEQKGKVNIENLISRLAIAMGLPGVEVKEPLKLNTAQNKNYNHVEVLMQAKPVTFPVEKPVLTPVVTAAKKVEIIKPVAVAEQKGNVNIENVANQLNQVLHIQKTETHNPMQLNTAQNKNYKHVEVLMQAKPVTFPVEKPVAVAKKVEVIKPVPVAEQKGNVNIENVTNQLNQVLHIQKTETHNPMQLNTAQNKNYKHVEVLMQAKPVTFPVEKPVTPVYSHEAIKIGSENFAAKLSLTLRNTKHNEVLFKESSMTAELKNNISIQSTMKKIFNVASDVPASNDNSKPNPVKLKDDKANKVVKTVAKKETPKAHVDESLNINKLISPKLSQVCLDNKYKLPKIQRSRFTPVSMNYSTKLVQFSKKTIPVRVTASVKNQNKTNHSFVLPMKEMPITKNESKTSSFVLPIKKIEDLKYKVQKQIAEKKLDKNNNKAIIEKKSTHQAFVLPVKNEEKIRDNGKQPEVNLPPKAKLPLFAAAPKKVMLKKVEVKKHVVALPKKIVKQKKYIVRRENKKFKNPVIKVVKIVKRNSMHQDENFLPFDGLPQ